MEGEGDFSLPYNTLVKRTPHDIRDVAEVRECLHAMQLSRRAKFGQIQGGLQRASHDLTKGGGVAIIFYFLRVKNITF